jgi:hypothetical protein
MDACLNPPSARARTLHGIGARHAHARGQSTCPWPGAFPFALARAPLRAGASGRTGQGLASWMCWTYPLRRKYQGRLMWHAQSLLFHNHYTTLHRVTPRYTALHRITPHYSTLHHITAHYTTLHHTTLFLYQEKTTPQPILALRGLADAHRAMQVQEREREHQQPRQVVVLRRQVQPEALGGGLHILVRLFLWLEPARDLLQQVRAAHDAQRQHRKPDLVA